MLRIEALVLHSIKQVRKYGLGKTVRGKLVWREWLDSGNDC
jgi:hypothetical protein